MISGYLNVVGAGSLGLRPRLANGEFVAFRVHSQQGPDTWLVSVKGSQVQVRSEIPLSAGDLLKARAHFERGQLFLKLVSRQQSSAAERFMQRQGIPPTPAYKNLLEALMRSELPLRDELVSYAARALFSSRTADRRPFSRFLAVMLDKGLRPASPEQAQELYNAVEGSAGDRGQQEGRDRREGEQGEEFRQRREGEDRRETGEGEGESRQRSTPEEAEVAVLPAAGDIREQCERRSEEGSALQLWNHSAGRRDNWIVVPLAWEHAGERIEGKARIRIAEDGADRFTLSVYARQRWHFAADLRGGRRRMSLYTDSERVRRQGERVLRRLRENLHNEAFEIDDTIKREDDFGLFDTGDEAEMPGIDRFA